MTPGTWEGIFAGLSLVRAAVPPRDPNNDEDEEDGGDEDDDREPAVVREPEKNSHAELAAPLDPAGAQCRAGA